jgi:hypothetical protein
LHIGQSEGQVLELWNEPTESRLATLRVYLIYTSLAMEVELQKGGRTIVFPKTAQFKPRT